MGRNYGDFARRTMRILFSSKELKNCVLPPSRSYLTRPALDENRFELFNRTPFIMFIDVRLRFVFYFAGAVRAKYHLASHLYDDFFKYHLGPKLGDFLVEERRREVVREARKQAKAMMIITTTRNDDAENISQF